MLDLDHPATNFIFQASCHLDQIKLLTRKLNGFEKTDIHEVVAAILKETTVLRNIGVPIAHTLLAIK